MLSLSVQTSNHILTNFVSNMKGLFLDARKTVRKFLKIKSIFSKSPQFRQTTLNQCLTCYKWTATIIIVKIILSKISLSIPLVLKSDYKYEYIMSLYLST